MAKARGRWLHRLLHFSAVEVDAVGAAVNEVEVRQPHMPFNVERGLEGGPYPCPCCQSVTLPERGMYELCPVCFWEDDGQDDHDANEVRGGPNGPLSLTQARANFVAFGASDRTFLRRVRPAAPHERPSR